MADKIVEMTAQQFRTKLQEMVRLEFARRLTETEEPTSDDSDKEEAVTRAKQEILRRLENAVIYKDRTSGVERNETEQFLEFIKDLAGQTSKESLMGVSSLEDLAGRIAVNYSTSQDWDKAKKEADSLTTKYIVSKGERKHAAKKEMMAANKEFKGKEEEILQTINSRLIPPRGSKGATKASNVVGFANWLKKNYPNVVDQNDDPVTAFTKYAEFWSQPTVPSGKSVRSDLDSFLIAKGLPAGVDSTLASLESEPEEDKKETGTYLKSEEGLTLQQIADAIGVKDPKNVESILKAVPPGTLKAMEDVWSLWNNQGQAANAKRSVEQFAELSDKAINLAAKRFVILMDQANEKALSKGDELNLVELKEVMDEEGLLDGLTAGEDKDQDYFLLRLIDIALEEPNWKAIVEEMLKRDLDRVIPVKIRDKNTGEVKVTRTSNLAKSFQNLISKLLGRLDPAYRRFGAGRPTKAVAAAKAQQQAEFPPEYKIGQIAQQRRAPAGEPSGAAEPTAAPAKRGRKPKAPPA